MTATLIHKDEKQNYISELALSWNNTGIERGDTVLLHSSLSGILKKFKSEGKDISPAGILESFISAVGKEGTLIFPTYNFEFTKGMTFDIRNSKSETGILSETARLYPGAIRTAHPLFSFAVIGYYKKIFSELRNYGAFSKDSPFAKLLELKGKIAALGVAGENCMTFYHHVEEMEQAPNRYHKIFRGKYVDINGAESVREYEVYSRKLEIGVETDVKPMEEYLWSKGLYKGYRPGEGNSLHVIEAKKVYDEAALLIREGRSLGMLYRINKES